MTWWPGEVIEHRHLCGDRVWCVIPAHVVRDSPDLVVTYMPGGAPLSFVPGPWPTANGLHPWEPRPTWGGHGVLMLQRPRDRYGVWAFWHGPQRAFDCWYLNIHEWSRDRAGHSLRDLELDVVVAPDGSWRLKDEELVDVRVAEGRLTPQDAVTARAVADGLIRMVEAGETWWDPSWASWSPPPGWDQEGPS